MTTETLAYQRRYGARKTSVDEDICRDCDMDVAEYACKVCEKLICTDCLRRCVECGKICCLTCAVRPDENSDDVCPQHARKTL